MMHSEIPAPRGLSPPPSPDMYSGLHPAITALIAAFSAVAATLREGMVATTSAAWACYGSWIRCR